MDKSRSFNKNVCRVCLLQSEYNFEDLYDLINFDILRKLKSFIQVEEV